MVTKDYVTSAIAEGNGNLNDEPTPSSTTNDTDFNMVSTPILMPKAIVWSPVSSCVPQVWLFEASERMESMDRSVVYRMDIRFLTVDSALIFRG